MPEHPPTPAMPRRFARPLLLLALEHGGSSHGYELYETVTTHGVSVDLAGVYRELRAMERHDLVSSTWEPSGTGPDRRVYELTVDGEAAAVEARDELERIAAQLTTALDRLAASPVDELGS